MRVFATAFFIFLSTFQLQAATLDWNQLLGCYKSVEIDGADVPMGSEYERSLTEVTNGISSVFENLDGFPLKHILFVLFTGASGPWYDYHSFVIFPEHGTLESTQDRLSYKLDEDFLINDYGRRTKVDHYLNVEIERNGGYLIGTAQYESNIRQMSGERSFTLERAPCK